MLIVYPRISINAINNFIENEFYNGTLKKVNVQKLNNNSFKNSKVKVINTDAFKFLENSDTFYDVIIVDLPDPNNSSLARLYSREFYKTARKRRFFYNYGFCISCKNGIFKSCNGWS